MANGRYHKMPEVEEAVLRTLEVSAATYIAVEHILGVNRSTVWGTLNEKEVHPYHLHRVQELKPGEIRPNVRKFGSCLIVNRSHK